MATNTALTRRGSRPVPARPAPDPDRRVAALPRMPLKQKVTFQQEAGFHASAFAKTEGKLRNYCRWAIAKLKAERSIGQDFEEMGLQRGGSKARGSPLKKALEQLRISK